MRSRREAYYIYMPHINTSVRASAAPDPSETINELKVKEDDETKPCSHIEGTKTITG